MFTRPDRSILALALFSAACGTAVACATGTTLDDDAIQTGSAGTSNSSGGMTGGTSGAAGSGSTTGSSSTASTAASGTGGTGGAGGLNGNTGSGAGGSFSNSTGTASTTSTSSGAAGAGGGTTCGAGTSDCDGNPGCEDLQTNPNHCGMCNMVCPMAEGGPQCTNGKCHNTVTILYDQIEDSFIHSGLANNNLGSDGALLVDDDDVGAQYITFIQPTTLGTLPIGAGATIVNARLELTCYNPGNNFGVHLVTGTWTESTITWNSAPPFTSSAFITVSPQCSGGGTSNSINIASALTAWAGGQAQFGLRLRSSGSDGTDYRSTEYGTASQRPKIVFTYY